MMGKPFWLNLFCGKVRRVYFLEMEMRDCEIRLIALRMAKEDAAKERNPMLCDGALAAREWKLARQYSDFMLSGIVPSAEVVGGK